MKDPGIRNPPEGASPIRKPQVTKPKTESFPELLQRIHGSIADNSETASLKYRGLRSGIAIDSSGYLRTATSAFH